MALRLRPRRGSPYRSPNEIIGARKLFYVRFLALGLFLILVLQLAHLQLARGSEYRLQAELNRLRLVSSPPSRGLIYDRQGRPLTENRIEFTAVLVPALLPKKDEERILTGLARFLRLSAQELRDQVKDARSRHYAELTVKRGLAREEAFALKERLSSLPGVELREESSRSYPVGEGLAHVLGYVGPLDPEEMAALKGRGYQLSDRVGKTGVELVYESYLRGRPGLKQVEVNANGREIQILAERPSEPGLNLTLTVDERLQALALRALREAAGDGIAAAVAMDVRTGELLALASLPTFDNSRLGSLKPEELASLLEDPRKPLLNHATGEVYAPGSPFK
ncbi:MAG TPA: penicillin-binding transpeptidase domain-containing protein, partial [Dehalococcoidia bacterium]|nr:penicillin-binding transpeptidase domain-containing protein [Dehalococcoidia bacterium]